MHKNIPLVRSGENMQNALITMTKFGFGCVGIVDDDQILIGMITDGDLRRHMSGDLLSKLVNEVMTKSPIIIDKNILASELLHTMEERKITNIFVTDSEKKPMGLVHIHDLLMRKIA